MEHHSVEKPIFESPQIKKYSSIYSFIEDVYQYKKNIDAKFTLDLWSLELGFKSRAFAYLVYHRKKSITGNFVQALARNLKMTEKDQEHLFLLFDYARSKKISQRKFYLNQILQNREGNWINIEAQKQAQFLSSQDVLLIKLILAFEDIEGTESEVSTLLGIKKSKLRLKLKMLQDLGMISHISSESKKEIIWKAKEKAFDVTQNKDATNEAINLFHQSTSVESLNVLQKNEMLQKFRSIFFAIPDHDFPDLIEEIESFANKIRNKYGTDYLQNKRMIKLNVQAYPVTEKIRTQPEDFCKKASP